MTNMENGANTQSQRSLRKTVWARLTAPPPSLTEVGELRSARLAASFLLIITLLNMVGAFARIPRMGFSGAIAGVFGFSIVLSAVSYALARTTFYRAAIFVFSVSFSATAYISIFEQGNNANFVFYILVYVPLSLVVASSFLSPWAVFLLTGLNVGSMFATRLINAPASDNLVATAGVTTTLGLLLIALSNFRNNIEKDRLDEVRKINRELEDSAINLEKRVNERTVELGESTASLIRRNNDLDIANTQIQRRASQFEALAQVSQSISSIRDLQELLSRVATVISENFGFYHVGLFLLDEANEYAVLSATNSAGGRKMIARSHRLRVGAEGIVGNVTSTGNPRIALDVGKDAVFFNNPELPETHSEMALPLRSGEQIIGALDVQSTETGAFTDQDVQTLSLLAGQVSLAIENARLFDASRRALAESEIISRQSTREAWKRLPEQHKLLGYRYNVTGASPLRELVKVEDESDRKKDDERGAGSFAVPIELRGEVIGTLLVQSSSVKLNNDQRDLVKAVADRVALSAENARLFEETNMRAERERTVSDITSKIRSHNDPQAMIETAISELRTALGATKVEIIPQAIKDSKNKKV